MSVKILIGFLGRVKVIPTVVEREYTPDITWQIWFACKLTGFYMIRSFAEKYFLRGYSYISESHFYFANTSDYCFKLSLSRVFCINSSIKLLFPQYEGPSTHTFYTSLLCTFIIYRKKEIGFVAKFFSRYFFWAKNNPELYVFMSSQIQESS